MKLLLTRFYFPITILLVLSCADANTNETQGSTSQNVSAATNESQRGGIVGEWDQEYTCYDKNGNYKLDPDEKKPSGTRLGFNWFRFNADGSCLRDKDVQFKGTYKIEEKNGEKKLVIEGGDNLRYTIESLTDKELILGAQGAFIVFKRV